MKKTHIMINHSLTKDTQTVSWGAIQTYHISERNWDDIGYHWGVENAYGNFLAMLGRQEYEPAAACYQDGMNRKAIHICCVGNFDEQKVPDGMLTVLIKRLIKPIMERHDIHRDNIVFHREYAEYKSCPGNNFTKEMLLERL